MADMGLATRSPLAGTLRPGRHGRPSGAPGVTLQERTGVQLVGVTARRGQAAPLAAAVRSSFGLDLPSAPRRVGDAALAFVWSGPDQWLAVAEHAPDIRSAVGEPSSVGEPTDDGLEAALRRRLHGLASIVAQGDGRVVLRLAGPRVRDALSRVMAIDLHPRAFRTGDTAVTAAAHIGVQIWQRDDAPTYELSAFRSFSVTLYGWLVSAAEDDGIDVVPAG